jgi:hypothetical protein
MNNHYLAGSSHYQVGFLDSGTTFTYLPDQLFAQLKSHFDWYCKADDKVNCGGNLLDSTSRHTICFDYQSDDYPNGPRGYFATFPVLRFILPDVEGGEYEFNWWPSEYLYKENAKLYCVAADT